MPLGAAVKTYFKLAFTDHFLLPSFFNIATTIGSGTPFKLWVEVDINVFFELQVFCEYLLGSEQSYLLSRILKGTYLIRTLYAAYLAIGNVKF